MKRAIFAALVIAMVGGGTGCKMFKKNACDDGCRGGHCGLFKGCGLFCHGRGRRGAADDGAYAGGPPVGQVTYPYYTNRGPRDFLAENPRGIGP